MQKITLSVKEVATLLGVTTTTVYTLVREKQVPHARIRGSIVFHRQTIEQWLINGGTESNEHEAVLS